MILQKPCFRRLL